MKPGQMIALGMIVFVAVFLGAYSAVTLRDAQNRLMAQAAADHAARLRLAKAQVESVESAALLFRTINDRWPDRITELTEKKHNGSYYLDRKFLTDPWGTKLRIDDVQAGFATSAGPDRVFDTADDISYE